ncbi:MAG: succinylglutamate desuccinylase/aspartoacylase family protein [Candidatus Gracilibacteria bacterium]|nr:succinylglutamate desuccinylase/aspartoacylase family protein [Candidatus Gracilibacteria bacterium]
MQTPIILTSNNPGPRVAIFGGIHGNEICGIKTLDFLRDNIRPTRGTLILCYGNVEAIKQGKREVDYNLNRLFLAPEQYTDTMKSSYEYTRAQELIEVLDTCDYLLDIHSSPTDGSPPFIICEDDAKDIAEYLPFDIRSYGFSTVEPGGTEGYMYTKGKIGIGVECGNHNDPAAILKARETALSFLGSLGMVTDVSMKKYPQKVYRANYTYRTQTDDFKIARKFEDFETVKQGDILGYDSGKPILSEMDGNILFARDRKKRGVEGFVMIAPVGV